MATLIRLTRRLVRRLYWSLLTLLITAFPAFADSPAGRLMFVHGEAVIKRDDEEIAAARGEDVYPGDTLETQPASSVQIRFSDGGTTAIKPDSRYTLEAYESNEQAPEDSEHRAELVRGGMRVITGAIGRAAPDNVNHDTPVATMGIRGTGFEVLHVPEAGYPNLPDADPGSYLRIESGLVAIITEAGTRLARPGEVFYAAGADQLPESRPEAGRLFDTLEEASMVTDGSPAAGATPSGFLSQALLISADSLDALPESIREQLADEELQALIADTTPEAPEPEPEPEPEPDPWLDYDPGQAEAVLSNSPGDGSLSRLYTEAIAPQGAGSLAVEDGTVDWGYWESGTAFADDSQLEESLAFIAASPSLPSYRSLVDAGIEVPAEGWFFFWADGTPLVALDGTDAIDIQGGRIDLLVDPELGGSLWIELDLGEAGRLVTPEPMATESFSLGEVLLEAGDAEDTLQGGLLFGEYLGDNADAIMTLIEAWAENGPGYIGSGVFERDDLVIDFPGPE